MKNKELAALFKTIADSLLARLRKELKDYYR